VVLCLLASAGAARAQDLDFRVVDDRQVKRGLTLASDSTVALSAGPGVGGANFRLKRSRFFERISSSQIKLRIYITPNLNVQDGVEQGADLLLKKAPQKLLDTSQKILDTSHNLSRALRGKEVDPDEDPRLEDEEPAEEPVEEEGEVGGEEGGEFDFLRSVPNDPTPYPRVRLFLLLNYGTADAKTDFPLLGVGRSELGVSTTSYRLGVGVKLDLFPWFSVLPTFSASYNNVRGEAEGNGLDSALLRLNNNRRLVNWRSESYTLIPEVEVRFIYPFDPFELRLTFELSYLETRTFSASTSLHNFTSRSVLGAVTFEFDWNSKVSPLGMDLHLVPAFRYVRIEGDASEALATNDLVGAELALLANTTDRVPFSSRLGIKGTYLVGLNLEAWSIAISHEF
jgi:hypothetical protein